MSFRTILRLAACVLGAGLLGGTVLFMVGCVLVLVDGSPRDEWGYVGGKDTVDSLGGGRWEMVKSGSGGTRRVHLHDRKTGERVVSPAADWREVEGRLLVLGQDGGYTVLNLRTGEVRRFERVEDAPEGDRRPLSELQAR